MDDIKDSLDMSNRESNNRSSTPFPNALLPLTTVASRADDLLVQHNLRAKQRPCEDSADGVE